MRKSLTVTVDAWGNIIVAGPVHPEHPEETFVAKLDKDGNLLWQRGLQSARTSSLPPPAPDVAAADDPRDSVEPQLLDELTILPVRPLFGRVAPVVATAVLAACAVAGGSAVAQHLRAPGAQHALMQHDVVEEAQLVGEAELLPASDDPTLPTAGVGTESIATDPLATEPVASVAAIVPELVVPEKAAEALREETLALLTAGLPNEALPHARALVSAAPTDATSYLFLGATLQELRKANEAREIYNDCVKLSLTGNVSECFALGGRK